MGLGTANWAYYNICKWGGSIQQSVSYLRNSLPRTLGTNEGKDIQEWTEEVENFPLPLLDQWQIWIIIYLRFKENIPSPISNREETRQLNGKINVRGIIQPCQTMNYAFHPTDIVDWSILISSAVLIDYPNNVRDDESLSLFRWKAFDKSSTDDDDAKDEQQPQ